MNRKRYTQEQVIVLVPRPTSVGPRFAGYGYDK